MDDQFLQNGFPQGQVEKETDFFGAFTGNSSVLWNREFGQTYVFSARRGFGRGSPEFRV